MIIMVDRQGGEHTTETRSLVIGFSAVFLNVLELSSLSK